MQMTMTPTDETRVAFVLNGRFDAHETPAFNEEVQDAIERGQVHISVDLSNVEFVDSSGLASLTSGMKRCREQDGDLELVSPSDPVRVILELTRLDRAFVIR